MDIAQFDEKIVQLEKQGEKQAAQMEEVTGEFLRETSGQLARWYEEQMNDVIKSNPEQAKSLGKKGLGEVKKQLGELQDKTPNIVEQHLNQEGLWQHRAPLGEKVLPSYNARQGWENRIRTQLAEIANPLAKLFTQYKFNPGTGWRKDYPHWKSRLTTSSEETMQILSRYGQLFEEYANINQELRQIRREKLEAEAQNLWDEA